jgi:hypothetical protein
MRVYMMVLSLGSDLNRQKPFAESKQCFKGGE